jgi:AbrB family looped-hinge helix DNA binding protein
MGIESQRVRGEHVLAASNEPEDLPLDRPLTVRLGSSRQVMIPKKIYDRAGLAPGDFLEVELRGGKIVYTPKVLVDKDGGA